MKCKHEKSCGYEICMMEECCDYEEGVMTNVDRIRAMSDEELAWAIDPAIVPPGTPKLEWLREPAEVAE